MGLGESVMGVCIGKNMLHDEAESSGNKYAAQDNSAIDPKTYSDDLNSSFFFYGHWNCRFSKHLAC